MPLECPLTARTLEVAVVPGTTAHRLYGRDRIEGFYYCTFGLNPSFQRALEQGGLRVSGTDETGGARIIELPEHPFFVGTLFVPGDSAALPSTGDGAVTGLPHPLVAAYVQAALGRSRRRA